MITIGQVKRLRSRQIIYEKGAYSANGAPVQWRVNGVLKLWKTRPDDFEIPIKHGLGNYAYLTHRNAHLFSVTAPASRKPAQKAKKTLRTPRPYYPEYGIR